MALKITDDCINCGACISECPNQAIYEAGENWVKDGKSSAALNDDHTYIATEKCTECVGFFDEPQCASVCPTGACVK